jgi:hypothetical protein
MKHLANGLFLGGVAILLAPLATLGGCSDDEGSDVPPKTPGATAGSGGQAGSGSAGAGGSLAGAGGGGNGGTSSMLDAGMEEMCTPVFLDAGVVLDAGTDAGGDAGDGGPVVTNGPVSFAADVYPILTANCVPCHATDYSGGHNVASPDEVEAYGFAQELKGRILQRVNGGGMPLDCYGPPGSPNCLSVAEVDLIRRWSAQCFPP